jgi:hypothetical protein
LDALWRCHTSPAHVLVAQHPHSLMRSLSPVHPTPTPAAATTATTACTSSMRRNEARVPPAANWLQREAAEYQFVQGCAAVQGPVAIKQNADVEEAVSQPAGHKQSTDPAAPLYRPAGQGAQADASAAPAAAPYVPTAQPVGAPEPAGQKKPAVQFPHTVREDAPVAAENVPAGQGAHAAVPSSYVPAGQGVHAAVMEVA